MPQPHLAEVLVTRFNWKSFKEAEKKAREVLRERGLSEAQIEAELTKPKRWPETG